MCVVGGEWGVGYHEKLWNWYSADVTRQPAGFSLVGMCVRGWVVAYLCVCACVGLCVGE